MSQRQYIWCGDSTFADQAADDTVTIASTPEAVRRGAFNLSFVQQKDVGDSGEGTRTLLSVNAATMLEFNILPQAILSASRGTSRIEVNQGGQLVQSPIFTHTMGRAVHFGFDAVLGRVAVVSGHEEAATETDGTPWDVTDDFAMRLGGLYGGAQVARGNVSLPYYRVPG